MGNSFASILSWKIPYRKFNLTVWELAPFLDGRSETAPRRLIDDFAGFAARELQRQKLLTAISSRANAYGTTCCSAFGRGADVMSKAARPKSAAPVSLADF